MATLSDLTTDGTPLNGTGVFDVVMRSLMAHITAEYENNRIKGNDYATVYLGALQYALAESVKFLIESEKLAADIDREDRLADAQIAQIYAAIARNDDEMDQKILLMRAQTTGFTTDAKQKILKQMLDGFAVNLSVAGSAPAPAGVQNVAIDAVLNDILDDLGSAVDV